MRYHHDFESLLNDNKEIVDISAGYQHSLLLHSNKIFQHFKNILLAWDIFWELEGTFMLKY